MLLRLISWPYFRRHLLRSGLTVAGIALGVAVFTGMHTANQSVLYGLRQTVDRVAGSAQLQVWAGETGFAEEVLERVQAVAEVRAAAPVIEAVVSTQLGGQGSLLILGVDMTGDSSLRQYDLEGDEEIVEDPLLFLAQPDSLIVSREFAARNGLGINSRLALSTMEGPRSFAIRGLLGSGPLASVYGGNLAIMDIYAAQKMFGRGRRFDRIDVAVREEAPVEQARAALEAALGPGFQIQPPSGRAEHLDAVLSVYTRTVNISSVFAMFIGMFLIYNSFAIAVTQRRAEIGILRALGAGQGQIRRLFLAESAAGGLAGSALGVVAGILLARAIVDYISALLGGFYGISERAHQVALDPYLIAGSLAGGVATSMFAAWLPARQAARIDPVQAIQKGRYQVLSAGENRRRRVAAVLAAGLSVLCLPLGNLSAVIFYGGYLLSVLAALLLTPTLALWLARALRPALRWLRPVEGALAADSLIQAPRRTSATVAALMLAIAMVIALAGAARAAYRPLLDWLTMALNPDLFVTTSQTLADGTFRFPASMREQIEGIQGVEQVQSVRSARIILGGSPVMLVAAEIDRVAKRVKPRVVAGDPDQIYRLATEGRGVIVSENLAQLRGLRLGQVLDIPTPGGSLRLPIAGITRDFSGQQGTILVDRSLYRRWWQDDTVNVYRVYLRKGASAGQVRQSILERFGAERRLFVLSNLEIRQYVLRVTDQWFGLTYVQIAVAVLVAVMGIVNTLTVSITDRRRELGVLQAVGGLRRQVRHTIWMEAVSIGSIGTLLGLGLGAVSLYYTLEMTRRYFTGMIFDFEYPGAVALALGPVMLAAAWVSSLWPAESAVRMSLVEALEYE